MGFARGLAVGTQVGNSWVNTYRDAKLKAGLSKAGNFSTTDVADGEEAHTAGLKARQFKIDQLNVDAPDYASQHKQVMDEHAPMMSELESGRGRSSSQMVQLPGGRRIEQEKFTPEDMAGLRAEQASKVYSEQGYPEEAAKSTLAAQGIAKNRLGMQKDSLELKELTRKDKLHTQWGNVDDKYYSLGNPETSVEEKEKNVHELAKVFGPAITADQEKYKGITFKGLENDPKEGMHVLFSTADGEGRAPLTMEMIHQGYAEHVQSRDPVKYADFKAKRLEHRETQAGLDRRNTDDNDVRLKAGREQNASQERIAGIRAAAVQGRGGSGGIPGLTPELNEQRMKELAEIDAHPTWTSAEKDDAFNRVQMRYNAKASQLRESTKGSEISVADLKAVQEMIEMGSPKGAKISEKREAANRMLPGAGDRLYDGGGSSQGGPEVRTDKQGNMWVMGPNGVPVPYKPGGPAGLNQTVAGRIQ